MFWAGEYFVLPTKYCERLASYVFGGMEVQIKNSKVKNNIYLTIKYLQTVLNDITYFCAMINRRFALQLKTLQSFTVDS